MQANTAHQLAEVYEALGNTVEAASMRLEVQAKVKDVREVVDENLAKAVAKSAQAHSKVDALKAQVLAHWHEAEKCVSCHMQAATSSRAWLRSTPTAARAIPF